MSLRRYQNYKKSGTEWLGDVPEHWRLAALKHNFEIVGGSTPKSEVEEFWDGAIIWVTPADLSNRSSTWINASQRTISEAGLRSCGTTLAPPGSIVLSTRAPIGSLAIAATELCTNQGCKSLVPHVGIQARYFAYVLGVCTADLNIRGRGTTFVELSGDALGAFHVCVPPTAEQEAIARVLDNETAKIDSLVSEQRQLIELLAEKRKAVITLAVTKGLTRDAPLKASGIGWLDDIPTHWVVKPLKYSITKIEQGWSPQCEAEPADEGQWGVLKVGCGNHDEFDPTEQKALPDGVEPESEYEVKSGDILVSRGNTLELVGSATFVRHVRPRLMLSDLLYRFRAQADRFDPEFLVLSLRSSNGRFQIERSAVGTSPSMKKIGQGVIRELLFPHPSIAEQHAIVAFIKAEVAKLDVLVNEAERAVQFLRERRVALITAAVTGKIDVRETIAGREVKEGAAA